MTTSDPNKKNVELIKHSTNDPEAFGVDEFMTAEAISKKAGRLRTDLLTSDRLAEANVRYVSSGQYSLELPNPNATYQKTSEGDPVGVPTEFRFGDSIILDQIAEYGAVYSSTDFYEIIDGRNFKGGRRAAFEIFPNENNTGKEWRMIAVGTGMIAGSTNTVGGGGVPANVSVSNLTGYTFFPPPGRTLAFSNVVENDLGNDVSTVIDIASHLAIPERAMFVKLRIVSEVNSINHINDNVSVGNKINIYAAHNDEPTLEQIKNLVAVHAHDPKGIVANAEGPNDTVQISIDFPLGSDGIVNFLHKFGTNIGFNPSDRTSVDFKVWIEGFYLQETAQITADMFNVAGGDVLTLYRPLDDGPEGVNLSTDLQGDLNITAPTYLGKLHSVDFRTVDLQAPIPANVVGVRFSIRRKLKRQTFNSGSGVVLRTLVGKQGSSLQDHHEQVGVGSLDEAIDHSIGKIVVTDAVPEVGDYATVDIMFSDKNVPIVEVFNALKYKDNTVVNDVVDISQTIRLAGWFYEKSTIVISSNVPGPVSHTLYDGFNVGGTSWQFTEVLTPPSGKTIVYRNGQLMADSQVGWFGRTLSVANSKPTDTIRILYSIAD